MGIRIKAVRVILYGIFLVGGVGEKVSGQNLYERYPFLREDLNVVVKSNEGLTGFYHQLDRLETRKIRTVNVVHIGDSHIQADWMSGQLRALLQTRFGTAGRGLVFPYAQARTNGPVDIQTNSNVSWQAKRTVHLNNPLPVGVSGLTLTTQSRNASLKISLRSSPYGVQQSFNKVTVFAPRGKNYLDWQVGETIQENRIPQVTGGESSPLYHKVAIGETLSGIANKYRTTVGNLQRLNGMEDTRIFEGQRLKVRGGNGSRGALPRMRGGSGVISSSAAHPFVRSFYLPEPTESVILQTQQHIPSQDQTQLYGVVLENYHQSGILYHMVGVNGAKFEHYNKAGAFWDQIQALKPDLIIISLGTNETVGKYFSDQSFFVELDDFIYNLESYVPHGSILLTAPPDAYRAKQYENPSILKARNIMLDYATGNSIGFWDLYGVMGGQGSVQQWYSAGLAQSDKLHFNRSGYELQGKLLFDALMKGYESYLHR
ncbi:MAG: LysM peptidoglycan-binding domain-containing protein [Bacteroidota bacterium]